MSKFSLVLNGIALIAKEAAKKIAYHKHTLRLADSPCHDDLYMVSYPKSGATWMNFLMANIHLLESKSTKRPTFFNIPDIIPDIHLSLNVRRDPVLPFPGYRVFKSHDTYNPYYKKVICIIRDPRDVMVSYYHFMQSLGRFEGNLSEFVRSKKYGISSWCKHVRGWVDDSPVGLRISFIRYEDLKKDAFNTLKDMYLLLGHKLDEGLLQEAINASSFENMSALEKNYGWGGRASAGKLKFMRKGKSGGWVDELSADDVEYIKHISEKWMAHFGYE